MIRINGRRGLLSARDVAQAGAGHFVALPMSGQWYMFLQLLCIRIAVNYALLRAVQKFWKLGFQQEETKKKKVEKTAWGNEYLVVPHSLTGRNRELCFPGLLGL